MDALRNAGDEKLDFNLFKFPTASTVAISSALFAALVGAS
jgi:hypothetical protein